MPSTRAKRAPVGTPRTQRLRKVECEDCGVIAYLSRKALERGLLTCACGQPLIPADLEDARLVLSDEQLREHPAWIEWQRAVASIEQGQKSHVHRGNPNVRDQYALAERRLEQRRRSEARERRLAAIRPPADPIPF